MELAHLGPVLLNTVSVFPGSLWMYCLADSRCSEKGSRKRCTGALHISSVTAGWAWKEGGRKVRSCWAVGCRTLGWGSDPRIRESVPDANCSHPQAGKSRCREEEKAEVGVAFLGAWETQCLLDRSRVCAQCCISRVQGDPWRSS